MTESAEVTTKPSVLGLLGDLWASHELLAKIHATLKQGGALPVDLAGLVAEIEALIPGRIENGPEPKPDEDAIPTDFGLEEGDYEMVDQRVWIQGRNIAVKLYLDKEGLSVQLWPVGSIELDPLAETRLDFVEAQALIDLESEALA